MNDDKDDLTIVGGDDFLRDQGIENPDEFRQQILLSHEIGTIINARGMTIERAAELTGKCVELMTMIVNYRAHMATIATLEEVLAALDPGAENKDSAS